VLVGLEYFFWRGHGKKRKGAAPPRRLNDQKKKTTGAGECPRGVASCGPVGAAGAAAGRVLGGIFGDFPPLAFNRKTFLSEGGAESGLGGWGWWELGGDSGGEFPRKKKKTKKPKTLERKVLPRGVFFWGGCRGFCSGCKISGGAGGAAGTGHRWWNTSPQEQAAYPRLRSGAGRKALGVLSDRPGPSAVRVSRRSQIPKKQPPRGPPIPSREKRGGKTILVGESV